MAKIDYSSDSCILSINGDVIGRLDSFDMYRGTFDAQMYEGSRNHEGMRLNLSVAIPNGMKLKLVPVDEEFPEIGLLSTVMMYGVKAFMTSMERSGTERTENGMTILPDFICRFTPYSVPKAVHPMCAAMTNNGGGVQRDWLKHFAEQTINKASSVEGKTPTNVIVDEPHGSSLNPCQICGGEPMLKTWEANGRIHNWMICTGCGSRTVVRSMVMQSIRDWSQGDMWSEPPQARAGRYFPKEIADAINAGKHVESSATPSAAVGASEPGAGDDYRYFPDEFAKRVHEVHSAQVNKPSDSKPTNVHNPESEDTPPHNPVMGPVVGTTQVKFHDQSKTIPPEVGKRYVCRNGIITPPMKSNILLGRKQPYFFCEIDGMTTYWGNSGRCKAGSRGDLIAEYHEPEPSQPAESPDDWVTLTDPDHVLRSCDEVRYAGGSWHPCRASVGAKRGTQTWEEFRCRRKDLPVVPVESTALPQFPEGADNNTVLWVQAAAWTTIFKWCYDNGMPIGRGLNALQTLAQWILDLKASAKPQNHNAAPADKPRMRQVTLREYRHTDESTAWSSSGWLVESRLTGRTCVTEVPE